MQIPLRTHRTLFSLLFACCLPGCSDDASHSSAWKDPLRAAENATQKNQLDAAARHFRGALAAIERSPDVDQLSRGSDFARIAGGLARVYAHRGEIARAESLYKKLLTIQTSNLDRDGTSGQPLATTLASLAGLSLARSDYQGSKKLFQRILSMQDEGQVALEPIDQLLAYTYGGLGKTYAALGDSVRADSLAALSMSLRLYSEAFGLYVGLPPWVESATGGVTDTETAESFQRAESAYRQAVDFQTTHLGEHSPHVARTHKGLGWLLEAQQRYDEALNEYRAAADILSRRSDALNRAAVLEDLASLLRARGEEAAADSASAAAATARVAASKG